jgi:hemolysin activation/secretion protein
MSKTKITKFTPAIRHPLITSLVLMCLQTWAIAADAPVTPGSVQDTLPREKTRLPDTPPQVVFPVQTSPSQHDPRATRFRVNAFDMTGNTVYKQRILKTVLERFVDLELNLYDLNRAAETITKYYHDHGYTLARAIIPAQKVVKGVVNIQIIEGHFGKILVTGNQRFGTKFITDRTALLQPGVLVRTDKLENNLLLLNDLPGLSAKVVLEPGAQFGTSDAEIQINEKLLDGNVTVNNFGREETGQRKADISLNINSPFGWGDQLALSGSIAERRLLRYWKVGYSAPLNTEGTRLIFGRSKAEFEVSGALAALGITGVVDTEEMTISHPFMRSRAENHTLTATAKITHLKQSALGSALSDNTVKVINATYLVNAIHRDASVTNASFGLTTNFHSVSSNPTSKTAVFARMEIDISHTTPVYQNWDMFVRANIVHSKEMLPDTEKFSLGGPTSVRAFRSAEVRGDGGYLAALELRRPFSVAERYGVFRLTAEAGEVTYQRPGYNNNHDRLRSLGFGATVYPAKGVSASLDVAVPTKSTHLATDSKKNMRVWVNISASF